MTTINATYGLTTALQQLQAGFTAADTDGSKALSLAEFTNAAKTMTGLTGGTSAKAQFGKLDTDGNGALTSKELTSGLNLNTQVYNVLLQGQEMASGGAFMQLLNTSNSTSSLFGNGGNDYTGLTSALLGGNSTANSLLSILTGGNTNTSTLASLFGLSDKTAQQISSYIPTDTTA